MTTQDFPYQFDPNACKTCSGRCCRGFGGYVWISAEELEKMATARGMDADSFSNQYVRQAHGKLSLKEVIINGEHLCCFFDYAERRCMIYENRPRQCRTFPFWEAYRKDPQELLRECPGVADSGTRD